MDGLFGAFEMNRWCVNCNTPILSEHVAVKNCRKCGIELNEKSILCRLGIHAWNKGIVNCKHHSMSIRGCTKCGLIQTRFLMNWNDSNEDRDIMKDVWWPFMKISKE